MYVIIFYMDNFFKSWFSGRRETTTTTTTSTSSSSHTATGASWETKVVSPSGRNSLLVPAWYQGVRLHMQTMGQLVLQYQRLNKEGGNFVEDRYGESGRLNYLLQVRPNPMMTASVMQEQIEFRKIYFGNAYVYIQRDEYAVPRALWLCTGGGYNLITHDYTLTWNAIDGPHVRVQVPAKDVLHFRNVYLTDDYTMGIPTLTYAFKALSIAATADEQALQDVAKGGRHKVLLQEEKSPTLGTRGRANREALRDMRDQFSEDWAANDVVMLDNIADAKIISQTSQQLQLLEQRSFQVSDLARVLGIPRIMMMDGDGGSYKMPEHATQEFLLRTIQPKIREHEDEYNSKLLDEGDFGKRRIHLCELPLRRLDAKGQAEIDRMHLESGWSVNELRSAYDLPTIEGGDSHYISTNLAEVGSEKLRGSAEPINIEEGGEA